MKTAITGAQLVVRRKYAYDDRQNRRKANQAAAYDPLAASYSRMFADFEEMAAQQATTLSSIIERELASGKPLRILDPTCGIGTQVLRLAERGYLVTGLDICSKAVRRARREAFKKGLRARLQVADARSLGTLDEYDFDVVLSMGNSLCAFDSREDVFRAINEMGQKLRHGGLLILGMRDYAIAILERPVRLDPALLCDDDGKWRLIYQVWRWIDETRYIADVRIDDEGGGQVRESITCRAVMRNEVMDGLSAAGLVNVRWISNGEGLSVYRRGFDQLMVLATRAQSSC
jgi:SAM-dependent methyltransferase